VFCGGTEPGKRTPEGLWLLRFERAAGCIFVADVPRTRSQNGYVACALEKRRKVCKTSRGSGGDRYCTDTGDSGFLPEVREFITRHTAYNKHDTGWAKGAPSEDHTTPPSSCG
jgi:hypothetical protein